MDFCYIDIEKKCSRSDPSFTAISKKNFSFVLLNNFSMIAFASAIEPLRLANRMANANLFSWTLVATDGYESKCSNGTVVKCDENLDQANTKMDTTLICGGTEIRHNTSKKLISWIRKEARKGTTLGGLCTATHVLAKAGLLENKKCTIHWENRDSFSEEFPEHQLSSSIYTIDKNIVTAAGGTAAADLILHLIGQHYGVDLANAIADQMIYASIRNENDTQRLSIPTRIGVRHPRLASVLELMEESLEEPISPSSLADKVGLSTRQLERLFRRYLDRSPKRYYMELRLQKARNLLVQTDMTVINVALACGFSSPSHFSKCYRNYFSTTPYREKGSRE